MSAKYFKHIIISNSIKFKETLKVTALRWEDTMLLLLTQVSTRSNLPLRWDDPGCTPNNFDFVDIVLMATLPIHFIPKTKCLLWLGWILDQCDQRNTNQLSKKNSVMYSCYVIYPPKQMSSSYLPTKTLGFTFFLKKKMKFVNAHTFWNNCYHIECCFGEYPSIAQSEAKIYLWWLDGACT